jgi:hypothetical protein
MGMFEKHFTVAEANALLPHVLSVFEKVQSIRAQLEDNRESLDQVHGAVPGNGGSHKGQELVEHSEAIGRLLAGLEEQGILVKDPDAGLIDFPHIRDEHEVFLCWRMGEKTVAYWHEVDGGFRGRQPL